MDQAIAKARQVQAAQETAAAITKVSARLDAVEAKLDRILSAIGLPPGIKKPDHGR